MSFPTDISRSFGHQYSCKEPWTVSAEVAPKLDELNLHRQAEQMRDEGYTIIADAFDGEFVTVLREAVIRLCQKNDNPFGIPAGKGMSAGHLLDKDPLIAEALLNPKIQTIMEYTLGKNFQLSQISGSVRYPGTSIIYLHMDADIYHPTPYVPVATACIALDDLVAESGPTVVVPGSQVHLRAPDDEEAAAVRPIPMEMKKGSVGIWGGHTWHSNSQRTQPGERVMLHMSSAATSTSRSKIIVIWAMTSSRSIQRTWKPCWAATPYSVIPNATMEKWSRAIWSKRLESLLAHDPGQADASLQLEVVLRSDPLAMVMVEINIMRLPHRRAAVASTSYWQKFK